MEDSVHDAKRQASASPSMSNQESAGRKTDTLHQKTETEKETSSPLSGLASLFGSRGNGLSSLFQTLQIDTLDTGDILLVLILLFLFLEGDNTEMVITLGLLLLMGL